MDAKDVLLRAAREAAQHAYAPYSHFTVGAALLTSQGKVYSACNVENASYGLTSCAERNALFKAVSEGERAVVALALASPTCVTPCGACRQVLQEFASGECKIYMTDLAATRVVETTLAQLFPQAFQQADLDQTKVLET
jgi:cytidine deaminase